jgi:hypothetical protein
MNAPTGKLTGIRDIDVELSSFYRLRSDMLDGFADIEEALLAYVSGTKICKTAPLGHKIAAAKKIPAGPQRSKELKTKADAELSKLAELLALRADLVHSRMEIAITVRSNIIAIFKNANGQAVDNHASSVFTLDELTRFVSSLQALHKSLSSALNARNPAMPKAKSPT